MLSVFCLLIHPTVSQSLRIQIIGLHHALCPGDEAQKYQESMYNVKTTCPEISAAAKYEPEWDILGTPVTFTGKDFSYLKIKLVLLYFGLVL